MPRYFRSDQAAIYVEVQNVVLDRESWSQMTGGDNTAEVTQVFPGGMRPLQALGGFAKPTALTVMRPWSDALIGVYKQLWEQCGLALANATYQVLNTNKEPFGQPVVYTGVLGSVLRPNYKAGTSEEANLTITIDLNGSI